MTFNYEYIINNPDSREAKIQKIVKSRMGYYQTALVEECLSREMFSYDDITNLSCSCGECDDCLAGNDCNDMNIEDIYFWISSDFNEGELEHLEKAGIPYINNDFGQWIGRTDCGSAEDIYFLPSIASALQDYYRVV